MRHRVSVQCRHLFKFLRRYRDVIGKNVSGQEGCENIDIVGNVFRDHQSVRAVPSTASAVVSTVGTVAF